MTQFPVLAIDHDRAVWSADARVFRTLRAAVERQLASHHDRDGAHVMLRDHVPSAALDISTVRADRLSERIDGSFGDIPVLPADS